MAISRSELNAYLSEKTSVTVPRQEIMRKTVLETSSFASMIAAALFQPHYNHSSIVESPQLLSQVYQVFTYILGSHSFAKHLPSLLHSHPWLHDIPQSITGNDQELVLIRNINSLELKCDLYLKNNLADVLTRKYQSNLNIWLRNHKIIRKGMLNAIWEVPLRMVTCI